MLIFIILFIFFLFFYIYFNRSPKFKINSLNSLNNYIYSSSFGTIKDIKEDGNYLHIITFLSLFDIHTQYIPINGFVIKQHYDNIGKFELAYKLNKSKYNEKLITVIKPILNIPNIYVQQIAGKYVRRIKSCIYKCPIYKNAGQKLGMITFGSRVDIILPKNNFKLLVKINDKVYGPNTLLGFYK